MSPLAQWTTWLEGVPSAQASPFFLSGQSLSQHLVTSSLVPQHPQVGLLWAHHGTLFTDGTQASSSGAMVSSS